MATFLKAYGVKNYRSFGGDGVVFENLKNINIFIGRNNTGKSNVLSSLKLYTDRSGHGNQNIIEITDYFASDNSKPIEFYFEVEDYKNFESLFNLQNPKPFIRYRWNGQNAFEIAESFVTKAEQQSIANYCSQNFHTSSSEKDTNVTQVHRQEPFASMFNLPAVVYISDDRKNGAPMGPVKRRLQTIWHYGPKNPQIKPIKAALHDFIKEAIDSDFELQFDPNNNDEFSVEIDGNLTQFSSLGKGVQQVFELALSVASTTNSVVLIDEPELNMHPNLVRQLVRLVFANDTNQYFIATHSNVLLDTDLDKSIHRIFHDGATKTEPCSTLTESRFLLDDLGVKASDLLQTNGVIWVEGPSDRTYINRWLGLAGSQFIEGLNYTFQYYGGKLLSHLTLDDDVKEFVNILNINRNAYIVMDSDWQGPSDWAIDNLAVRKKKIITETATINIPVWVTAGREIENYIPDSYWSALAGSSVELEKYEKVTDKVTSYRPKALKSHSVAAELTGQDLKTYDLEEKVAEIMTAITKWNQL
jgi:AAA15 family ATPase/GTPase